MGIVSPRKKKSLKIIIMLSIVWFACALPVPILLTHPDPEHSAQYRAYVEIAAIVSIPFIGMAIAWTIKPELTT